MLIKIKALLSYATCIVQALFGCFLALLLNMSVGCTDEPDLPWTATAETLKLVQQRCKDMREYDDVVCLPRGILSVQFEKAFGFEGKSRLGRRAKKQLFN